MAEREPVIEMQDYLQQNNRVETQDWLKHYKPGDKLDFTDVFRTQSVFYPACGDDGRALKLFSRAHAAHLFYYVDCGESPEKWKQNLEKTPIDGYHIVDTKQFSMDDLGLFSDLPAIVRNNTALTTAVCRYYKLRIDPDFLLDNQDEKNWFFVIFERDEGLGDEHGVERFAVAFVCEDAIQWYAALFAAPCIPAPTWLVVQTDMATKGLFERGEPLEQVADAIRKYPDYLLVAAIAKPWRNYIKLDNVKPRTSIDCPGKDWFLYKRNI
jgi:hypothetical protein